MKKLKKFIITILTLVMVSVCTYSFADVGSFDRYDSGSSSSWGSSSSSWGSSSSRRYSSSNYGSSGDSDGLLILLGYLLGNNWGRGLLIFIVILIIIYMKKYKGKGILYGSQYNNKPPRNVYNSNSQVNTANISKDKSIQVANQIMIIDPLFSEEKFISFTKELFVKLQNAWTAREWEPMRLFETPELFEQHKSQIQGYIDTNRINVMDRISVDYSYLYNFREEGDKQILEVALKSTMKDYIIDATTKQLLEGNKTEDRHTTYKLTFERKKGSLTEESDEVKTTNCPNCGAPTKITSAGKCEYCDSIIITEDHGWVLSNLEPLR